jgi:hypothetical protein
VVGLCIERERTLEGEESAYWSRMYGRDVLLCLSV